MQLNNQLPVRVRALIVGGGIHGAGVLHDICSRGWKDCLLLEKATLGSGTSSKSSKLIHGGLRYLRYISQYNLVMEGLRERALLFKLAPDIVTPIKLMIPLYNKLFWHSFYYQCGLSLYDMFSRPKKSLRHKKIPRAEFLRLFPHFQKSNLQSVFQYTDGQTDDLALVSRVAQSAKNLGGQIHENAEVISIQPDEDGFQVNVKVGGTIHKISCLYVLNCAGPWAHNIQSQDSQPLYTMEALNNKGVHFVTNRLPLRNGLLLESKIDKRIFFALPWKGYSLIGTTESIFQGDPDQVSVDNRDLQYLLGSINGYLEQPLALKDIECTFAGLRWLAVEPGRSISSISRFHKLDNYSYKQGMMLTLIGGKLTSYRSTAKMIADKVFKHFGDPSPSKTHLPEFWAGQDQFYDELPNPMQRFSRFTP